ncbi:MAG TPA: amidohydrolase family protein, partial [Blastocatellia bacterium]|nr:amidohydrolase family protein [Blastocatellia bacterium]
RVFLEDLRGFTLMSEQKETTLIRLLVEKGVRLIPTMAVRQRAILEDNREVVTEDGVYAREPELTYVPESVRKEWSEATIDKRIRETFGPDEMGLMREGYRRLERFVRNFREAGGVVLAGSDNLNGISGLSLRREIESLVGAGLTPMQSLIAATRDAAQFLRQPQLGTIERSKKADLVILNANPLSDIRNLRRIDRVFQNGREVNIGYHRNYVLPPPRPELVRPIYFERLLSNQRQ